MRLPSPRCGGPPVFLAVVLAVAACGTSGTELRDPPPGATSPRPTTSSTTAPTAPLAMSSPDFVSGGLFPERHTCTGGGVSPALEWRGLPTDTVEVAITVTSEIDDTVHWVLTGIAPGGTGFGEGAPPLEAIESTASDGSIGWFAPCPAEGTESNITFTLHALTQVSAVDPALTPDESLAAVVALPGVRAFMTASAPGPAPATTSPEASDEPDPDAPTDPNDLVDPDVPADPAAPASAPADEVPSQE